MVTVQPVGSQVEGKEALQVVGLLTAPAHLKLLETLYSTKLAGWLEEGTIKVSFYFQWHTTSFLITHMAAQPCRVSSRWTWSDCRWPEAIGE